MIYGQGENVWDEQNLYPEFQSGSDEQTVQKKGEYKKGGAKAMATEKRRIETTAVRCPGLPYPDYTELDKLIEEGWRIVRARCEPDDYCVYFSLERDIDALISILKELQDQT